MNFRTHWRRPLVQSLPPGLRDWLTDRGSLTHKLRQTCLQSLSVSLLQQGWQRPFPDESLLLGQKAGQWIFSREVQLLDGDKAEVYARTLVPRNTFQTMRARFETLGSRPLGEILFNAPSLRRGPIEVACLQPGQAMFQLAAQYMDETPDQLWARRSCFYLADKRMLVNEIFLLSDKWGD